MRCVSAALARGELYIFFFFCFYEKELRGFGLLFSRKPKNKPAIEG